MADVQRVDSHDMAPTDDAGAPKDYSTLNDDDRDEVLHFLEHVSAGHAGH